MTKVASIDRLFDLGIRGKFGRPMNYGDRRLGGIYYGEEEPLMNDQQPRFGIYQRRTRPGKPCTVRGKFYIPSNPKTVPQEAWRATFANGMASWGGLTQNQKNVYNENAKKYKIHGVNLYMREWLNSN